MAGPTGGHDPEPLWQGWGSGQASPDPVEVPRLGENCEVGSFVIKPRGVKGSASSINTPVD